MRRTGRARCRSRARSTSSATTSARIRPRTGSGWRPAARCACATPASSRAREVVKDAARRGRSSCAALGSRRRGAAARPTGASCKGTLHWVSAAHAVPAEVRLYDRLFAVENPGTDESKSFLEEMNPDSLVRARGRARRAAPGDGRKPGDARAVRAHGLLLPSTPTAKPGKPVWNRTVDAQGQLGEDRGQGGEARGLDEARRRQRAPRRRRPRRPPAPARRAEIDHRRLHQGRPARSAWCSEAELVEGADKLLR